MIIQISCLCIWLLACLKPVKLLLTTNHNYLALLMGVKGHTCYIFIGSNTSSIIISYYLLLRRLNYKDDVITCKL